MEAFFWKFHGTGNDFILLDDRLGEFAKVPSDFWKSLCCRRFGIGADGIIMLRQMGNLWWMHYLNADGHPASFCGNGSRCFAAFCHLLGLVETGKPIAYQASDGAHESLILKAESPNFLVKTKMRPCLAPEIHVHGLFLDTGSPHLVVFTETNPFFMEDFVVWARAIRNENLYKQDGINVNLVQRNKNHLNMRTYERGVEDETWSCGTGTVAAALASQKGKALESMQTKIHTLGGKLQVSYRQENDALFDDIWLEGPARFVFKGTFQL